MGRSRYILTQLNSRFVVTDSQVSSLKIVNDQAGPADITNPAEVKFFGMTLAEAKALASKLNG